MPMVKCPNCGRERLVVEGKRKKCRKCGTPLTSVMGYPATPENRAGPAAESESQAPSTGQVDEAIDETLEDAVEEPTDQEFQEMTRAALLKFAKDYGIEIDPKMRKKKILAAIKDELSKPDLPVE